MMVFSIHLTCTEPKRPLRRDSRSKRKVGNAHRKIPSETPITIAQDGHRRHRARARRGDGQAGGAVWRGAAGALASEARESGAWRVGDGARRHVAGGARRRCAEGAAVRGTRGTRGTRERASGRAGAAAGWRPAGGEADKAGEAHGVWAIDAIIA